jgi:hypothetical protein
VQPQQQRLLLCWHQPPALYPRPPVCCIIAVCVRRSRHPLHAFYACIYLRVSRLCNTIDIEVAAAVCGTPCVAEWVPAGASWREREAPDGRVPRMTHQAGGRAAVPGFHLVL